MNDNIGVEIGDEQHSLRDLRARAGSALSAALNEFGSELAGRELAALHWEWIAGHQIEFCARTSTADAGPAAAAALESWVRAFGLDRVEDYNGHAGETCYRGTIGGSAVQIRAITDAAAYEQWFSDFTAETERLTAVRLAELGIDARPGGAVEEATRRIEAGELSWCELDGHAPQIPG
ncbi:hypothetical protein AB0C65_38525 [Nocardia sp. NPDC048505]|uniref:hypothetical protein n=1 Tax=Nocardia sp. NPDC048505 TaxID=3155756 RepID=UPI0033CC8060